MHNIELREGKYSMAWAGETPWHGLGTKVSGDLTPTEMLEAANLNWSVEKVEAFIELNGKKVGLGKRGQALVRSDDQAILDVVSDDWSPCQNQEAFDFFNDFVEAGEMNMETAGSLQDGRIVWALAKVNDSFELFGGKDRVDNYLLFTNPHKYGQSIDVRMTPVRVVCNNTLSMAVGNATKNGVKVSHRNMFDAEAVKRTLGVAHMKLTKYKEAAEFLATKRFDEEGLKQYFGALFPSLSKAEDAPLSRNAQNAIDLMDQQPGAELGEGTWWQAFNSVTFLTNHIQGRSQENRLASAWYGANRQRNADALKLALEMAA